MLNCVICHAPHTKNTPLTMVASEGALCPEHLHMLEGQERAIREQGQSSPCGHSRVERLICTFADNTLVASEVSFDGGKTWMRVEGKIIG